MAKPQHLVHNRKPIFHMDFSNLKNTVEIKSLINESIRFIRVQPPTSLLTLTNIQGMHFSNEIKELFTDFVKGNKPYVKAGAVIGMSGMQQIVYNGLMKITGRDIKAFSTAEEAKNWLVGKN
jgi:hypothetical protein